MNSTSALLPGTPPAPIKPSTPAHATARTPERPAHAPGDEGDAFARQLGQARQQLDPAAAAQSAAKTAQQAAARQGDAARLAQQRAAQQGKPAAEPARPGQVPPDTAKTSTAAADAADRNTEDTDKADKPGADGTPPDLAALLASLLPGARPLPTAQGSGPAADADAPDTALPGSDAGGLGKAKGGKGLDLAVGRSGPVNAQHGLIAVDQAAGAEAATKARGVEAATSDADQLHPLAGFTQALAEQTGLQPSSLKQDLRDQPAADAAAAPVMPAGQASTTLADTAPASEATPVRAPFEAHLAAALDAPGFGPAVGAQVSLLVRDGIQEARLQLNPADMGPVSVQISLDGNQAHVAFSADLAATRAALENSLPDLAAALSAGGFTLAGGGVFQQASGGARGDGEEGGQGRNGNQRLRGGAEADLAAVATTARTVVRPRGVLDTYA